MLDSQHRAILMDLGSVALAHVNISSRKEAMALQELCAETVTASFRAPELFDPSSNSKITEATDIWFVIYYLMNDFILVRALGCTIYAMAYGKSPCK